MASTQTDRITCTNITINGCPGTGKSATYLFAKMLRDQDPFETYVLLNGKPVPETHPDQMTTCTGNLDYLKNIYDPETKHKNFNTAMLVGFNLLKRELDIHTDAVDFITSENYLCNDTPKCKEIIFIWERDSMTAGNIFIRANQYNCLLDSKSAANPTDNNRDWDCVKVFSDTIKRLAKIQHRELYDNTFLFTMIGDPQLCLEKVRSRGRPYESTHFTLDYMEELDLLHKEFAGITKTNRGYVETYKELYAEDKTPVKHIVINTDKYYNPEKIQEMKDAMSSLMYTMFMNSR
uniref:ORF63 n=1 Tax=Malaco herpesvirus 1 TaxID=3031797 RepID=A0AA48SIR2_9VIRU|nr:TPA_asm: ORF63 [Malaco herpesvirus 1]